MQTPTLPADLWNAAALAGMRGEPCPADDPDSLDGHAHGVALRGVRVVMPVPGEGYYDLRADACGVTS